MSLRNAGAGAGTGLALVLVLLYGPVLWAQNRSPAMNEARQRLQHLFDHQNGAESSWRNHRQLLRERPASATEGVGATVGAALGGESGSLVRARELGVQSRQCIAGVQALVDALPATTAQLPSTITTQFTRCEGFITQENALFERYRDESQSAGAVGAFVAAVPVQTMEALQRIGQFYLRGFARMAGAPTQTPEPQPSFANRSRLMPDAEDTMLASANNDLQRWAGQRAQNVLRGRRGAAALPPLYVPNYVPYLIESEFIRTRGITAAQRNEAVLLWQSRLEHYRSIAASTTDPMARIRRVLAEASRDFLEPYHRDDRSMLAALQGRGVNCEGRARFLYGVMSALNLELPAGWSLGVQLFPIHMELVLHNPHVQPPVIRLFGQTRNGMSGPIYHPALLLKDLIAQRSEAAPDYVNNSDLLMAASERPAPEPVSRTGAFLDQVGNLRSLTSRDGLGSTLPLPEAGEGDITEIPEYSLSPAPDPDRPMPVELPPLQANAAPANGHENPNGARPGARLEMENEDVNLGRPMTAEQIRASRLPVLNTLRSQDDVLHFCQDLQNAMARVDAPFHGVNWATPPHVTARGLVRSNFLRQLYFRIPVLSQLGTNPDLILSDSSTGSQARAFLTSVRIANDNTNCINNLFPTESPLVGALGRLASTLATRGRWHDLAVINSFGLITDTTNQCNVFESIPSVRWQVIIDSPSLVSPPATQNATNQSPTQNAHNSTSVPGPIDLRQGQWRDAASSEHSTPSNTRISFDDALLLLKYRGCAGSTLHPAVINAVCAAPPSRIVQLWNQQSVSLFASTMPLAWESGNLQYFSAHLSNCQAPELFNELYLQIERALPYSRHCGDSDYQYIFYPDNVEALNLFVNLINSRVTNRPPLPRISTNTCTRQTPRPAGNGNPGAGGGTAAGAR